MFTISSVIKLTNLINTSLTSNDNLLLFLKNVCKNTVETKSFLFSNIYFAFCNYLELQFQVEVHSCSPEWKRRKKQNGKIEFFIAVSIYIIINMLKIFR